MTKPASHDGIGIGDAEEARIQAGIAADSENPEWTDEDFARARPAAEVLPVDLFAALTRPRGRPKAEVTKVPIKLRLDPEVVDLFKALGPGWQTRMNKFLASHDVVVRMIEQHEKVAREMRSMFRQIEKGDITPVSALAKSMSRTRRGLDATKVTITSLRALLTDQAVKHLRSGGSGV